MSKKGVKKVNCNKLRELQIDNCTSGTNEMLELVRSEKKKYITTILGKKFIVHPNVFSPKYFNDTQFFIENLPIKAGDTLLEIGSGTGAIAIFAAYHHAKSVIATDINPDAYLNTCDNIQRHGFSNIIEPRLGNLFSVIKKHERFDIIFWNVPFGYTKTATNNILEQAVYDPFYRRTKNFIKNARKFLHDGGHVYMGFSSTIGKLELLKQFCKKSNLAIKEIAASSVKDCPVRFEILEITSVHVKKILL